MRANIGPCFVISFVHAFIATRGHRILACAWTWPELFDHAVDDQLLELFFAVAAEFSVDVFGVLAQ